MKAYNITKLLNWIAIMYSTELK